MLDDALTGSEESAVFALAPGLRVVRRGVDLVQVGLHARRVVLARTPAAEHLLGCLYELRPITADLPDEARTALDRLLRAGCVHRLSPDPAPPSARVAICGDLPGVDLGALLAGAGLTHATEPEIADMTLVPAVGEVDRELLDPLVRRGATHLVLRLVDGAAILGPFVVPGSTACLRCLDAHRTGTDPDHLAVTARYSRALELPRRDGLDDSPDPMLALVAATCAVRDLAAHAAGREPLTSSATLRVGPGSADLVRDDWRRHPLCGCSWPDVDPSSGTMEA